MFREIGTQLIMRAMIAKGHMDLNSMHRNAKNAREINDRLLFKILKTNQSSEYGRRYHFDQIKSIEEFRSTVPITTFEDYEPYVKRMIDGNEKNLLTSLPLVGYAQSSGSVGARKFVPLTQPEINIYTKYTVTRMLAVTDNYLKEKTGRRIPVGRGMFTCPSFDDVFPNGLPCSNIADVAAKQLGFIYPYILNLPFKKYFNEMEADSKYVNFRFGLEDKGTIFIFGIFFKEFTGLMRYLEENWRTIVDDIEQGTISDLAHAVPEAKEKMISVLKPNPQRAAELRIEFEKGFDSTILKRIWPNMSVICGIGTSTFTPFSKRMRNYSEGIVYDYSIYGASEGLYAAVDEVENSKQLLLADSCFYEFIPVDNEELIFSLDELEEGKEYEIVATNQAGLYRYKCGDVIRVVGYLDKCPYVQFSYRKGQLLNMTGEKTTEEHMAAVVKQVSRKSGVPIENWAVFLQLDHFPYHYVLALENEENADLSKYSDFAEEVLKEANLRYKYFSQQGAYGKLEILNQKPGTHKAWNEKRIQDGAATYQIKPVRILDSPEKEEFFQSRML